MSSHTGVVIAGVKSADVTDKVAAGVVNVVAGVRWVDEFAVKIKREKNKNLHTQIYNYWEYEEMIRFLTLSYPKTILSHS